MIELIDELPDNVVGFVARGRVTSEEWHHLVRTAVEGPLRRHEKVRLYYELGSRYPGSGWDDLGFGTETFPHWERIAVVTDTGWVRQTVAALRFLIQADVRVFTTMESEEGRAWIASSSDEQCPAA